MKPDLHFPAMPVMINLTHTEQMKERPRESRISVGLFVPESHKGKEHFSPQNLHHLPVSSCSLILTP